MSSFINHIIDNIHAQVDPCIDELPDEVLGDVNFGNTSNTIAFIRYDLQDQLDEDLDEDLDVNYNSNL